MERVVRFAGWADLSGSGKREWTLPASHVVSVMPPPVTTSLPGAPPHVAGLSAVEGDVIAVFRLSSAPREMLLCNFNGSPIGILIDGVRAIGEPDVTDAAAASAKHSLDLNLEELLRSARRAMRRFHRVGDSER